MRIILFLVACVSLSAQDIDLGLDHQTNSIVQLERAPGGTIWGVSGSSIDRLPTIAGVYAVRSTDNGTSWTTHLVTEDWWKWGSDVVAIDLNRAFVLTLRDDLEDTLQLFETTDGGATWALTEPGLFGLTEVHALHFFNAKSGVAFGTKGRKVSRMWAASVTTDGGLTWSTGTPVVQHRQEKIALRNGRAWAANESVLVLGMSSGRVFEISRADAHVDVTPFPTPYELAAVTISASGSVTIIQQLAGARMSASTKERGGSWKSVNLPEGLTKIRGIKKLVAGGYVTIPWDFKKVGIQVLSDDFSAVTGTIQDAGVGIEQTSPTAFVIGTEMVPGKGLKRVSGTR